MSVKFSKLRAMYQIMNYIQSDFSTRRQKASLGERLFSWLNVIFFSQSKLSSVHAGVNLSYNFRGEIVHLVFKGGDCSHGPASFPITSESRRFIRSEWSNPIVENAFSNPAESVCNRSKKHVWLNNIVINCVNNRDVNSNETQSRPILVLNYIL